MWYDLSLLMGTISIQMRLESYFKTNVQSTIPDYGDVGSVRAWDRHVCIRSRKWPGYPIQCDYFNRSFLTENESIVRCDYSKENDRLRPTLCHACPLERVRRVWVPVRTETRNRPIFISFRRARKFWNWQKDRCF